LGLLRRAGERRPPLALTVASGLVGVGLLLTPGLAGHAASGDFIGLAVVADVVHLAGVSVWLGGLTLLTALVLPRAGDAVAAQVVPRFSTVAFGAVTVILATGVVQSWRQVRSVEALTDTTYGKVLIVKVALFAAMVALGALSRAAVRRRFRMPAPALSPGPGAAAAGPDAELARLRRSVGVEAGLSVAVLLAAAILVYTPPARSALAQPFATEVVAEPLRIDVTVDPAKAGPTVMHFYTLTAAGAVQEVQEMTAKLQLPDRDVGPLEIPLQRAGPGHFSAYGFEVPIAGQWELELEVLLDEIDQVRGTATIPIR
ncbi:MAG: CopD family protein, partial [Actinomycetota bacterium]